MQTCILVAFIRALTRDHHYQETIARLQEANAKLMQSSVETQHSWPAVDSNEAEGQDRFTSCPLDDWTSNGAPNPGGLLSLNEAEEGYFRATDVLPHSPEIMIQVWASC